MNRLSLRVMAASLSATAAVLYVICAIFFPLFPNWAMYGLGMWSAAFPGFSWTVGGVVLGFVESALYGLLVAIVFVPLYNFFAARLGGTST